MEKQVLGGRLPGPPWPEPRSATSLRPPTVMRSCNHGTPASVCAGRVSPHHPYSQGPFASGDVLLPPSLLLRPHAPVSSTSEFPALRLYRQPRGQETFPALHLRPCDHAAAPTPESSSEASARLFPEDSALARVEWARRSHTPRLPSRGRASRRCSDSFMLRPGRLLVLLGSPVLRRRGLYPRSFRRAVALSRCPIRYVAVRLLPRPVLPRLV